ncbi:MAG: hypothetical protein IKW99_03485 [Bacteroidales bacterium]|nr:hypothetical protein [Bacteroidales bacterium]
MFQGLTQGSTITVLYKNIPRVADGRVISVNTHMPTYNPQQPMAIMNGPVTDITVQIGNETIPFAGLPANGVVANFPEKGLFMATEKSAVLREIEAMATASKQVLESVPAHQKMVKDCEALLVEMSPEKKMEAQQMQEITNLRGELAELKRLILASTGQNKKEE